MKRVSKILLIALLFALSSSFLFGKEAKAEACGPGYYSKRTNKPSATQGPDFKCTAIDSGSSATDTANKVTTTAKYFEYFAMSVSGLSLGFGILMIVYAGFEYATSGGDAKRVQASKGRLLQAGIGIFIALSSFILLDLYQLIQ